MSTQEQNRNHEQQSESQQPNFTNICIIARTASFVVFGIIMSFIFIIATRNFAQWFFIVFAGIYLITVVALWCLTFSVKPFSILDRIEFTCKCKRCNMLLVIVGAIFWGIAAYFLALILLICIICVVAFKLIKKKCFKGQKKYGESQDKIQNNKYDVDQKQHNQVGKQQTDPSAKSTKKTMTFEQFYQI